MLDIPELYVDFITTFTTLCHALEGLLEVVDLFIKMQKVEAVDALTRQADRSVTSTLARAVAQVPCWSSKYQALLTSTAACKVHWETLQHIQATVASARVVWCWPCRPASTGAGGGFSVNNVR